MRLTKTEAWLDYVHSVKEQPAERGSPNPKTKNQTAAGAEKTNRKKEEAIQEINTINDAMTR